MLEKNLNSYASDFFVIRTPLLPLKEILDLQSILLKNTEPDVFKSRIKKIYRSKLLQEAIYISSPVLFDELQKFLTKDSVSDKVLISLYQYLSRMSSRCTPFGLFAGFGHGKIIDEVSSLQIFSKDNITRYCRLDMDYLNQLKNHMIQRKKPNNFRYVTNSSIYEVSDKLRFIETVTNNNFNRYTISHVDNSEILAKILSFGRTEQSYDAFVNLIREQGATKADSQFFIGELIANKLLINSLEPNVTGNEYMHVLAAKMQKIPGLQSQAAKLDKIIVMLQSINEVDPLTVYRGVIKQLLKITPKIDETKLFQIDLLKRNKKLVLEESVIREFKSAANTVFNLMNPPSQRKIDQFKKEFQQRFETEAIRLTDVLDAEIGINYSELKAEYSNESTFSSPVFRYKFNKFLEANRNSAIQIDIHDHEIGGFKNKTILPDSLAMMIKLFSKTENLQFQGEFRSASGPSLANLLGRFCSGSHQLDSLVKDALEKEEMLQPDKIFAEIAHIPQARIGNILTRPHLRKYEIVFLAQSGIKQNRQITIEDLYLKMERGRLVLFSQKLQKEIIPRLSSAHNFSNDSLQIYHFLCDLQGQDIQQGITWTWDFLASEDFLPRVVYKNIVVSPAIWNIKAPTLVFFEDKSSTNIKKALASILEMMKIPNKVYLIDGDNELLLDLRIDVSIEILKKHVKKHKSIKFKESLTLIENLLVKDEKDQLYVNEIIVPLTNTVPQAYSTSKFPATKVSSKLSRNFAIGTEWIYFKIYTGVSTADHIIRDLILPFAAQYFKDGKISEWFFIRYNDTDFHIRVRFKSADMKWNGMIIQAFSSLLKPLIASREVHSFNMDTYKREIERYGITTMEISEKVFTINSMVVARIIKHYHSQKNYSPNEKFTVSILCISNLLDSFELTLQEQKEFVSANRKLFAAEFNFDKNKALKDQVQNSYRDGRKFMESLLERSTHTFEEGRYAPIYAILSWEKSMIKGIKSSLDSYNIEKGTLYELLASYVHMYINRLIISNNRFNEFLMYECLERYLISKIARLKTQ